MRYFLFFFAMLIVVSALLGCEREKYTEVEKYIIQQLKDNMHDPDSLEIISITSEYFLDYEHFDKFSAETALVFFSVNRADPEEDLKIYKLRYRGANAFGALRLNSIAAVAGKDFGSKIYCYFFREKDLLDIDK